MKLINYIRITVVALVILLSYTACEKIGPGSLEKPPSDDVTIDTIFSSAEYAERVLWYSYRSLRTGVLRKGISNGIGQQLQSDITDLSHNFMTWGGVVQMYYAGVINSSNASADESYPDWWLRPLVTLPFVDYPDRGVLTFKAIRNCHILIDNIYKVPDMSQVEKDRLTAEAKVIIEDWRHHYNHIRLHIL